MRRSRPCSRTASSGRSACGGDYEAFAFGLTYVKLTSDTADDGKVEADNLLVGASFTFDAWSVGAFYGNILNAEGAGSTISTATTPTA